MADIDRLLWIMERLRDPGDGCPWDVQQNFESIAPYTLEEAYEVEDAIVRGDREALREELGDLLFQVVYHAQMAREEQSFEFRDVVAAIADKLVRRHPHVFGSDEVRSAEHQTVAWEEHKARERAGKPGATSELDDVPLTLPALSRAGKLQKRAARVGFDWPDREGPAAKVEEEAAELREELAEERPDPDRVEDEIGDLLFAVVNLARHAGVDPEKALRRTNRKFERRFGHVEQRVREDGGEPGDRTLEELDALWDDAKKEGL